MVGGCELVEGVRGVEFVDGAVLGGVRRIMWVDPVAQLAKGGNDFVEGERIGGRRHESCLYLRRPQREGKAGALGDEHRENGAIERGVLGGWENAGGGRLNHTRKRG